MILHLGGIFAFYIPGHPPWVEVDLIAPTRLVDVLDQLGIPNAEIGLTVINGEMADLHTAVVSPGDVVRLIPPADGG